MKKPRKSELRGVSQRSYGEIYKKCHITKTIMQQSALQNLTTLVACLATLTQVSHYLSTCGAQVAAQQVASFPGVTRDLTSFCSARPSLSIDLAPMIVHVKRNTSFNYKLYLFSSTEHVFQTGQVVPRDDFRLHSFPVKLKQLNEFISFSSAQDTRLEVYSTTATIEASNQQQQQQQLVRVPNSSFNTRQFFAMVPLDENDEENEQRRQVAERPSNKRARSTSGHEPRGENVKKVLEEDTRRRLPYDVHGDALPGEESFAHHDVASLPDVVASPQSQANANEHIQFDRDDQLVVLGGAANRLARELASRSQSAATGGGGGHERPLAPSSHQRHHQLMVMPVGSFSSFNVNSSYLVRKDFDQAQAQVVRILVDAQRFQVTQVHLLSGFPLATPRGANHSGAAKTTTAESLPVNTSEDYAFLSHKLLRDAGTRITSITQIYEDWITRNFYTIVYVQRRPPSAADGHKKGAPRTSTSGGDDEQAAPTSGGELTTDRLIFRGSSTVLLGADQLDYYVKASAFVTEKNGLHYYLEFLPSGKFYLGAIDWTKRPFRFLDSRGLPIKPTRTLYDNEELLLCPPSVCYSDVPLDEIVNYGRLTLSDKLQRDANILSRSSTNSVQAADQQQRQQGKRVLTMLAARGNIERENLPPDEDHDELLFVSAKPTAAEMSSHQQVAARHSMTTTSHQSDPISLDSIISAIRATAGGLTTRLHLRDWVWSLPRVAHPSARYNSSKFAWHYEWAKRNEVKVTQDTYGFALTGHEIDASYRVFNELYLISANQLITINYTLPNETVTSVHPIKEEFPGLSSTLLDPITGAFYDRYSNQIYFFKGDRYVGFDCATKKPLEDFLLPSGAADLLAGVGLPLVVGGVSAAIGTTSTPRLPGLMAALGGGGGGGDGTLRGQQQPLVSSLPVVGILGRQQRVDAIYHDLQDDQVYVFSGMKFYTHQASDFKEGAFRRPTSGLIEPPMRCINEHFLDGCRFDEAYPNPCATGETAADQEDSRTQTTGGSSKTAAQLVDTRLAKASQVERENSSSSSSNNNNFSDEQQMKLRSIAARGGSGRLFDFLLENTLIAQGATRAIEPFLTTNGGGGSGGDSANTTPSMPKDGSFIMLTQSSSSAQERIVIYLLIAMVLITIMVTVAMIIVILNWSKAERSAGLENNEKAVKKGSLEPAERGQAHLLEERVAYPPAISQYLTNQYHQQRLQQQQQQHRRHHRSSRDVYPGTRRSVTQMPLPSPPPPATGPKPVTRIPFRSYITSGGSELGPLGPHNPDEIIDSSAL